MEGYDIRELAQMLSDEIDESGKTRWSAKDVKEFFLSQGINLPLYTILDVWEVCPNPVCACELLGCDESIMASDEDITADTDIESFNDFEEFYEVSWEIVCDRFYKAGYADASIDQNTQGCCGSTDFYEHDTLLYSIDESSAWDAAREVYDNGGTVYNAADAIEGCAV